MREFLLRIGDREYSSVRLFCRDSDPQKELLQATANNLGWGICDQEDISLARFSRNAGVNFHY